MSLTWVNYVLKSFRGLQLAGEIQQSCESRLALPHTCKCACVLQSRKGSLLHTGQVLLRTNWPRVKAEFRLWRTPCAESRFWPPSMTRLLFQRGAEHRADAAARDWLWGIPCRCRNPVLRAGLAAVDDQITALLWEICTQGRCCC